MFSLVSGVYQAYFAPPHINLLIVGAQGCGKTTLLERLKVTHFDTKARGKTESTYQRPQPIARGLLIRPEHDDDGDMDTNRADNDTNQKDGGENAFYNNSRTVPVSSSSSSLSEPMSPPSPPPPPPPRPELDLLTPTLVETPRTKRILVKAAAAGGGGAGPRRRNWLCPAPPKYAHAADSKEDEEEVVIVPPLASSSSSSSLVHTGNMAPHQSPLLHTTASTTSFIPPTPAASATLPARPTLMPRPTSNYRHSSVESMESVELRDSSSRFEDINLEPSQALLPDSDPAETDDHNATTTSPTKEQAGTGTWIPATEYDVKAGAKMLPLHRIRPTIGMNLGKVDICGAKCHVWDLGGRLQDLWERYYHDCDAVIFVWKLNTDDNDDNRRHNHSVVHREVPLDGDEDDSDDERPEITAQLQQQLLEQVRGAIPDDVPFLVLGHVFRPMDERNAAPHTPPPPSSSSSSSSTALPSSKQPVCLPDVLYSTAQVLPHYHNPCQALFFANAATGQGVRSAMEWLIPLAKRQLRVRERMYADREK